MGPDEFSDPITIPITITIPNPVHRDGGGRFDHGPSHHPMFTDPDWFARQRPKDTLAHLVGPIPIPPPLTLYRPGDDPLAAAKDLPAAWARARRR